MTAPCEPLSVPDRRGILRLLGEEAVRIQGDASRDPAALGLLALKVSGADPGLLASFEVDAILADPCEYGAPTLARCILPNGHLGDHVPDRDPFPRPPGA